MSDARIEVVAAVAANCVIGRGGELPWRLPDDLRHFKSLTMGHAVIMGRRTYESIGRPLPGRRSVVVSRTLHAPPAPGVEVVPSLDDAARLCQGPAPAFVIGGASLYAEAISRASVLHLTELDDPFDGNVLFPEFDASEWRLTSDVRHERDADHVTGFHFRTYTRVGTSQGASHGQTDR